MRDPAAEQIWADAQLAAALLSIDPAGLGGAVIRSGPGPVRLAWLTMMRDLLPAETPWARIPLHIQDDRLLGGLDLAASLVARRPVMEPGLLAKSHGGVVLLAMAERIEDRVGAQLAATLDTGEVIVERDGLATRAVARLGLIALDEGATPDERPPDALADRLAFAVDLNTLSVRDIGDWGSSWPDIAGARTRLRDLAQTPPEIIDALCSASQALGIASIRAPLLAVKTARTHAALQARSEVTSEDAEVAARLVLAPRAYAAQATQAESTSQTPEPPSPAEPPSKLLDDVPSDSPVDHADAGGSSSDQLIAAVQAALPEYLFARSRPRLGPPARTSGGKGSGAPAPSSLRGRPRGSRPGVPRSGERLDLAETLRAAAPWQTLRRGDSPQVRVYPQDLRTRRFIQRRESTTIFVVDASGSAAFQRLAEAKGAVELLLARAYVARTRVALVAFRKTRAEVLLAPTRSLTRAKRQLAEVVGGGGTPLAAGLEAALALALAEQVKARTPNLVILTDGRANIARDGSGGRGQAETDALGAARRVAQAGVGGVYIDTSPRPRPDGDRYARAMGAMYHPLPYCDAASVSDLVEGLRAAGR